MRLWSMKTNDRAQVDRVPSTRCEVADRQTPEGAVCERTMSDASCHWDVHSMDVGPCGSFRDDLPAMARNGRSQTASDDEEPVLKSCEWVEVDHVLEKSPLEQHLTQACLAQEVESPSRGVHLEDRICDGVTGTHPVVRPTSRE